MPTFSSPNRVVWEYFLSLRLLERRARTAPSPELSRQNAALAIIMAVTVVEVFFNLWFRVLVEEKKVTADQLSLMKDLSSRKSIEHKLKNWPDRYLGKKLDLTAGPGKEFADIKSLRNSIVHFTSTHETIDLGEAKIHGLADTTEYDEPSSHQAERAVKSAEALIQEIFRLADLDNEMQKRAMHAWTGKIAG